MTTDVSGQTRGIFLLGSSAVIFRMFSLILIDMPGLYNAGWLAIVLGTILSLPALALRKLRKDNPNRNGIDSLAQNGWTASCAGAILMVMLIYDAAASSRLLTGMAASVALFNAPLFALLIPAMLVVLLGCLMGAGTMGSTAAIWSKVAFFLFFIALLVDLDNMNPNWLTPILGPGVYPIWRSRGDSGGNGGGGRRAEACPGQPVGYICRQFAPRGQK